MNKKNNSIAEDCGRFFEIGFNIGILTYIRQHEQDFTHHLNALYTDDLRELNFPEMVRSAFKRGKFPSASWKRHIVHQWFMFFLQKGFLSGLNFVQEYLHSLQWKSEDGKPEIVYYQCSFCGDNSIYTNSKSDEEEWTEILGQLTYCGIPPAMVNLQKYGKKGSFLHADTLLLLHCGTQWRMLCIDLSVFSVTSPANMKDPNDIEIVRRLLMHELGYMRSKSVFTNLSIDTASGSPGFRFSKGLETYFTAFKRDDKESAKLIQAGSYAYDFYEFLRDRRVLSEDDAITINVVGYTDRGVNAMSVRKENIKVLETCADIYRRDTRLDAEQEKEEIQDARRNVLDAIRENAAYSFQRGDSFIDHIADVTNHEDGLYWIPPHRECIEDFVGTREQLPLGRVNPEVRERLGRLTQQGINMLDAHARLVTQELDESSTATYLFLTGNPGIGKTTAIVNFLKAHSHEGFLFFYVSPRKQVNLDIVNKFRMGDNGTLPDGVLALTTNSIIIHDNEGKPTVHYYSATRKGDFRRQGIKKTIDFLDGEDKDQERPQTRQRRLEQLSEQRVWDKGENTSGVLNSICNALYVSMRDNLSHQSIATVAIQSLKKTSGDGDTLKHLEKIFHDAFYAKKNRVLPEKMAEISSKIKHIFIMVDEVTGDESGVAFLDGINKFIRQYELTKHGFNTKVIVADASIVDWRVIEQHLKESTYEPDKIYFRHVPQGSLAEPLSWKTFPFKDRIAVAINANSYPAQRLYITYNVCVEFLRFDEETFLQVRDRLTEEVQQRIVDDLDILLKRPDVPQAIVYIQDKRRLFRLIEEMRKRHGTFEKNIDYLEIHANISEADKSDIQAWRDKVRVVFMTASASRGLSFPKTTHILVDIPHFEVEQNLMEIIQVIYRGRGEEAMDRKDKELLLYLSDRAIYREDEDRALSLRESILNLLNILLILKTSIMTRISGYGQIGREQFMMIPIGGKSVLAAGETYIGKMEKLIGDLKKEYDRQPSQPWLRDVYVGLRELLGQADFRLSTPKGLPQGKAEERGPVMTYLSIRPSFAAKFADAAYNGLHKLLDWEPMELGYISGGLLIVPFADKVMQEHYLMQLEEKLRNTKGGELWKKMWGICKNDAYPENLQSAMKNALELIRLLNEAPPGKTQMFTQDSQNPDQYYALPLLALMHTEMMKDYFADGDSEHNEDDSFRALLAAYVRSLYPVSGVLPIGDEYRDFPFVVFRSFNLKEVRNKLFSDTYLFISHEMNVLNMLLSYKD